MVAKTRIKGTGTWCVYHTLSDESLTGLDPQQAVVKDLLLMENGDFF